MKFTTLLCCINPSEELENISELTFYQILSPFGTVKNLKIISTYGQIKAFVQVENQQVADKIIRELSGKSLNIGRIKIFVSHKKFVAFEKSLEQILEEAAINHKNKPQAPLSDSFDEDLVDYKRHIISSMQGKYLDGVVRPSSSNENMNLGLKQKEVHNELCTISNGQMNTFNKTNNKSRINNKSGASILSKSTNNYAKINSLTELEHWKIIRIDNMQTEKISCQMLFNLFGCFGNILRLWFVQEDHVVFIEYELHKYALRAMKSANNVNYFYAEMHMSLSNEAAVLSYLNQKPIEKVKFVKGSFKFYRFKNDKKKPIKKLSRSLNFTNVSNSLDIESLCKLIASLHSPIKVIQGKFSNSSDESYIIKFKKLQESLEVLSLMHNRKVEGRKFNVEFIDIDMDECL